MGYSKKVATTTTASKMPLIVSAIAGTSGIAVAALVMIHKHSETIEEPAPAIQHIEAPVAADTEPEESYEEESVPEPESKPIFDPLANHGTLKPVKNYVHPPNPKHDASLNSKFAYTGTWENNDLDIQTFAGFNFGTDQYCRPGSLGTSTWTSRSADGTLTGSGVHRFSEIDLESPFLVFDKVEVTYSLESRKLAFLKFQKYVPESEENYEALRSAFVDCIDLLYEKYGMTYPKTNSRHNKDEAYSYIFKNNNDAKPGEEFFTLNAQSGNCFFLLGFREVYGHDELEIYLSIENKEYKAMLNQESDAEIERLANLQ